ncbi:MAG: hypothetical protein DRI01_09305 [Chloroflexi bacterium]|nr:MAG: hypothetical protein DRI01_09305 [Chloroflexota bacterium]
MTRQVTLLVNDQPITLDYFVQSFIDHTICGILASLEGTEEVHDVEVSIKGDNLTINLNNASLPTNPFVSKIIRNTIVGMVSSLKGVSEIDRVNIIIKR